MMLMLLSVILKEWEGRKVRLPVSRETRLCVFI
jgi:hypothetical protein